LGTTLQTREHRHRWTLAHVGAAPENHLLDLVIRDTRLPLWIGVVVRPRVQAVGEVAVTATCDAMALHALGVVHLPGLALRGGLRRAVLGTRSGEGGGGEEDRGHE